MAPGWEGRGVDRGLPATWLITWVLCYKVAHLLAFIALLVEGRCPVSTYRSFVRALQDALKATGGQFRRKGLYVLLAEACEADEGRRARHHGASPAPDGGASA